MSLSQTIYVALCFNNEANALALSKKLGDMFSELKFITSNSFDGFLKSIAAVERIDCLIMEVNYKECSAFDLIENFKKSMRYKKTIRVLFTEDLDNINSHFLELNNHYYFDFNSKFDTQVGLSCVADFQGKDIKELTLSFNDKNYLWVNPSYISNRNNAHFEYFFGTYFLYKSEQNQNLKQRRIQ